jgi:tRNA (adenine57-N1/adenine58-N1)-methyltransferase
VSGAFAPGDLALLLDRKGRQYLVTLTQGAEFHTHRGVVAHDDLIGHSEGIVVRSTLQTTFTVVRPTLADFVMKMPRGAQVIYPKDLGAILLLADIRPGDHVLEAGVGSGALSLAILRAGAIVVGYELRDDFAARARSNVERFLGPEALERYRVEARDVYEGIGETELDRIVLDVPEPWQVVKHAARALQPGGILLAYSPSIVQVAQMREALDDGPFGFADTREVLHRGWHVDGLAVRPDHRMVAHTGFLTAARLLG